MATYKITQETCICYGLCTVYRVASLPIQSFSGTHEPPVLMSMPSGQKHLNDSPWSSGLGLLQVGARDVPCRAACSVGQSKLS